MSMPMLAGILAVVLALAAVVYFFYPYPEEEQVSEIPQIETGPDVAAEVSGAVETPAEQLPQTNPFSDYKNPFE